MVVVSATASLLTLVGGGLVADLSISSSSGTVPLVGRTYRPAPAFRLPELLTPSRTMSLVDFRGEPVVLNFWASWCPACRAEMPWLESAYRSRGGAVQFLGIDTNDPRRAAISFLARVHVTYPLLTMTTPTGPLASAYGLIGLPITVFISPRGTVVGRLIGQANAVSLQAALNEAFGQAGVPHA